MRLGLDVDGAAELIENLHSVPDVLEEEGVDALKEAAEFGMDSAKTRLRQKTSPYGAGTLADTIKLRVLRRAERTVIFVKAGSPRTTKQGFGYEFAVEFGARPHFPPVKRLTGQTEDLDRWVRRMNPTPRTDDQQEMSQDELNEEVAYLIARKISRVGLSEQPFMRPGFNAARGKARKEVRKMDLSRLEV